MTKKADLGEEITNTFSGIYLPAAEPVSTSWPI